MAQLPDTADASNATDASPERSPRGIQSIEVGGQLLTALAHHGRPLALKDLAREAEMAPAKAHPYLVSFIKLGLVEQEALSGRYGLGPLALQLGLISLQQYDPVRLATPRIEELAQNLGLTVAIAVWGNRGPTIVRVAEAPSPVHISMRHGTVMSLRGTASGRLFAAHLPEATIQAALDLEPDRLSAPELQPLQETQAQIRAAGLASAEDGVVAGVSALAAPVFDDQGRMVLSLTAIGPSRGFSLAASGLPARSLKRAAEEVSSQLGWRPRPPP
ncbi:IclR family transcriptional regulator [Paucibacter sp. DJ1R-11]|uniref:IclR family transcriptional regulator n=1 Tax=Paucibacter sp. DJ1R-11 TaxID=2893556 RepID=UPI0021E4B2BA|nr:IclR family transcriptional regulator [Paucibacter sp. DJ1R-11]MCV2365165.1 IclR family transcriptional regulator [Paucibacter sp. DJ1R-11]